MFGTHDQTIAGNADGNNNCDMDSATVEGRDDPGRTTSSPDTTTAGKTGRHSGSNTHDNRKHDSGTKADSTQITDYDDGKLKKEIG